MFNDKCVVHLYGRCLFDKKMLIKINLLPNFVLIQKSHQKDICILYTYNIKVIVYSVMMKDTECIMTDVYNKDCRNDREFVLIYLKKWKLPTFAFS